MSKTTSALAQITNQRSNFAIKPDQSHELASKSQKNLRNKTVAVTEPASEGNYRQSTVLYTASSDEGLSLTKSQALQYQQQTQLKPKNLSIGSTDQTESALLSQDKVNLINEMNEKRGKRDNFYAQFISKCLGETSKEMISSPLKKKNYFETDLDKIKLSSHLLDIIDKQVFVENTSQSDVASEQSHNLMLKSASKRTALDSKQKEKLFQVLADTDKIVIHTSQNKDFMIPSERKDVVRLARWLEDMIEKIYMIKDLDFFEYFENMQLVCSACMSELIRQIGLTVQERGQLVKRVWESILNLMRQAFEQVTAEKIQNEKTLKEEIKQTHRMYLKKLDEYIPQIENYKKLLDVKEQQNKRVILEFRYLRKKDAKLEKYLKLTKKDLKVVEDDYFKLDREYQNFKNTYDTQEQFYQGKIAELKALTKQKNEEEEVEVSNLFGDQHKQYKIYKDAASKVKKGFKNFNNNFEEYSEDVRQMQEKYAQDVRYFQKVTGDIMPKDEIEQMEDRIYSKKGEIDKLFQMDDRIIEEIGCSDGITLVIGHCSTQTGPDLLKMTHQSVDTSSLTQFKDRTTQTFEAQIDVKEVQTPSEWMDTEVKLQAEVCEKNTDKKSKKQKLKVSKFAPTQQQTQSAGGSLNEIIIDGEMEQKREEMELAEKAKLEKMTKVLFLNEDEEIEERKKLYELPFLKDYLQDSPSNNLGALIQNWKSEEQEQEKKRKRNTSQEQVNLQNNSQSLSKQQQTFKDALNDDSSDSESDSELDNDKSPGSAAVNGQNKVQSPIERKLKESINSTLKNAVERDLDDLHLLIMSRTSYVTNILEKIISFDLLKENPHIQSSMISKFINDSKKIIDEEHLKLKKIWERSKNGMIDIVKSKIIIAEKDAELEEVQHDKVMIEHQIMQFQKEITILEEKRNEIANMGDAMQKKKPSISSNSLENITDEDEVEEDLVDESCDDGELDSPDSMQEIQQINSSIQIQKGDTNVIQNRERQNTTLSSNSANPNQNNKKKEGKVDLTPQERRKSKLKSIPPNSSSAASNAMNTSIQLKSGSSGSQGSGKKPKRKETQNPLNRVSVSLIEAVSQQQQQIQQKQQKQSGNPLLQSEKTSILFQEIQRKNQFSLIVPQSQATIGIGSNPANPNNPTTLSIGAYLWVKSLAIPNWKLDQPNGVASPNADSAAFFFNNTALKFLHKEMNTNRQEGGKSIVMKSQNVLRHIASIYTDKMKSLKSAEEDSVARTLNLVTYDYFLNQFGFKKLAETKLKQFLSSCIFYSLSFKIRTFSKLYGINKIMNYDFEDFEFFAKMLAFIEEGSSAQQLAGGITPINRATEALFRNFENKIPASEMLRLKQELDNLKVPDITQKQKNKFAVDIDHALDILLQALVEEKKITIQSIQSLFLAIEAYSQQVIAFDEFLTLLRHVEKQTFDFISASKFYYLHCDLLDKLTGQRIMSFQKFALTAIQTGVFSQEAQDNYIKNNEQFDRILNIEMLEKYWEDKKDIIRLRFVKNGTYSLLYRQMIKKIDKYFSLPKEARKIPDRNTTWFTYRLLDDESKRMMTDALVGLLIPEEFSFITSSTQTLVKKILATAL